MGGRVAVPSTWVLCNTRAGMANRPRTHADHQSMEMSYFINYPHARELTIFMVFGILRSSHLGDPKGFLYVSLLRAEEGRGSPSRQAWGQERRVIGAPAPPVLRPVFLTAIPCNAPQVKNTPRNRGIFVFRAVSYTHLTLPTIYSV